MSAAKTQDEQEAPNPLHHVPAACPGEEVSPEAVPFHRRARRVLQLVELDGNPGEDLVPEQESQSQAAAGGRAGETENGSQADAAPSFWDFLSSGCARPRIVCGLASVPEALAAGLPRGTLRRSRGIQYVPPRLTRTEDQRARTHTKTRGGTDLFERSEGAKLRPPLALGPLSHLTRGPRPPNRPGFFLRTLDVCPLLLTSPVSSHAAKNAPPVSVT